MKIKVILLVAVLLCGLCVSGSARWTDISDIENTDTIFVWESGLDLTGVNASVTIDSLRKYTDDDRTKSLRHIIPVTNPADFDVSNAEVSDQFGVYYIHNATFGSLLEYIIIKKPVISWDVVLSTSHSDSINGESIDSGTNIAFKIMSPLVGAYYKYGSSYPAQVKIEFTTPSGGKTYILNNTDFSQINITKTTMYTDSDTYWGPTNLAGQEGTYRAVMKWETPAGFRDYASSSSAVTFTIQNRRLSVTSEKTSVVQGNHFVTTVSGKSDTKYVIYIQNAALSGATHLYPELIQAQPGVDITPASAGIIVATGFADLPQWEGASYFPAMAYVTTKADGTRPLEWTTNTSTDERTFTIKVTENTTTSPKYDTVRIKVEKSAVTITASGDGSYYLGKEVTLSGTNTDSNTIYLFITGPNLRPNGVSLIDPTSDYFSPIPINVYSDDSWIYKWDTTGLPIDAGTYTIYATAWSAEKSNLSGIRYDTVSVVIKKPFIQANTSSSTVTKGERFYITGTAEGDPNVVAIWVFGENFYRYYLETVDDNMVFSKKIEATTTADMEIGEYFIVAQHPMYNGILDIAPSNTLDDPVGDTSVRDLITPSEGLSYTTLFWVKGEDALQGSNATMALIDAFSSPNIDDTYSNISFTVENSSGHINIGGDEAWYTIHTNVQAEISFDGDYKGTTSGGQLTVSVYTTATPYLTVMASSSGYQTASRSLPGVNAGETTDVYLTLQPNPTPTPTPIPIPSPVKSENLTLSPGWNFISTPRQLASGNNTFAIFSEVDTDGRQILGYNANAETWMPKQLTDSFDSMTGIWIYANESATIHLNYATGAAATPPIKTVYSGWNAIGLSDSSATSASNALTTIENVWKIMIDFNGASQSYGTSIINGAIGSHAETRDMIPKRGYWLYATGTGTLAAISA